MQPKQARSYSRAERAFQPMAGPSLQFDLAAEIKSLRQEREWDALGRNSVTLVKHPDLRVVLTAIKGSTRIKEYKTAGRIVVQTLEGHIQMHVAGLLFDLPAGHTLTLDREMDHDVLALEDSAFLLTIAWPGSTDNW